MNKCPLCGSEGTEIRREWDMRDGKLVDEITCYCQHDGFGIITFYTHEPLTIYPECRGSRGGRRTQELRHEKTVRASNGTSKRQKTAPSGKELRQKANGSSITELMDKVFDAQYRQLRKNQRLRKKIAPFSEVQNE